MQILLISLAAIAAPALAQGEITERISTPVDETLRSPKPPQDLELCAADAITSFGMIPSVFQDGETRHVIGFRHTVGAGVGVIVSLRRTESETTLEVRGRGDYRRRVPERLTACL